MLSPGKHLNKHYRFEGQDADETILYVIHRHWFNILVQFIPIVIGFLAIIGSTWLLLASTPGTLAAISPRLILFIESLLLVFLWFFAFLIWIDYYLDVWIITDKKVVNIEQKGLFVRSMSEIYLFRVQDTTTDVTGFFPSILDYGDVFVQSAGEQERFLFHKVPDPYGVKDAIMDLASRTHQEEVEYIQGVFHGSKGERKSSVAKNELLP